MMSQKPAQAGARYTLCMKQGTIFDFSRRCEMLGAFQDTLVARIYSRGLELEIYNQRRQQRH